MMNTSNFGFRGNTGRAGLDACHMDFSATSASPRETGLECRLKGNDETQD